MTCPKYSSSVAKNMHLSLLHLRPAFDRMEKEHANCVAIHHVYCQLQQYRPDNWSKIGRKQIIAQNISEKLQGQKTHMANAKI